MPNWRSPKLLNLAQQAPHCMSCGRQDGTIVMAHSNQQSDGKGIGIKAHDYRIAALCYDCHTFIDQAASRETGIELWERAHRKTIGWLFESGHLQVR